MTTTADDAPVWLPPLDTGEEWMDYWHGVAALVAPSRYVAGAWAYGVWHESGRRPPHGIREIDDGFTTAADARAAAETAARAWVERRERERAGEEGGK